MIFYNKYFQEIAQKIRSSLRDSIFGYEYSEIKNYMRSQMDHEICPEGVVLIKYYIHYKW